jgi:hypothetical protein
MAESIVVFHSGERVITDLQEQRENNDPEGKPLCFVMVRPYILSVEKTVGDPASQEVQVRFTKWLPYAIDKQFRVAFNTFIAIGTPDEGLVEAYRQTVAQAEAAESQATRTEVSAETGFVPTESTEDAETPEV